MRILYLFTSFLFFCSFATAERLHVVQKNETLSAIAQKYGTSTSAIQAINGISNPNLLFVGTEFGVFFTYDRGEEWKQIKAGLPTIAVKDIEIQERENDLVLATFGRSFYVLDDYSSLRSLSSNILRLYRT